VIFIALIVSWPLTYLGILKWLQAFANRMPVSMLLFVAPLALVILITMLTISFNILRAATANPIDSIKHE
jgi:putative ABC transport system permease protein